MVAFFYARLKKYSETFADVGLLELSLKSSALKDADDKFIQALARYTTNFHTRLKNLELGTIAKGHFDFPEFQG